FGDARAIAQGAGPERDPVLATDAAAHAQGTPPRSAHPAGRARLDGVRPVAGLCVAGRHRFHPRRRDAAPGAVDGPAGGGRARLVASWVRAAGAQPAVDPVAAPATRSA